MWPTRGLTAARAARSRAVREPPARNEIAGLFGTLVIDPARDAWHRQRWSACVIRCSGRPPRRRRFCSGVAAQAQILTTAKDALGSAKSVRLQGTMTQSGSTYTVDIVLGPGLGKGTVTGPIAGLKRASFDFVALGSKAYIRSSTLWRQFGGAAAADLFDNRWVATTAKEMFGDARFSTLS